MKNSRTNLFLATLIHNINEMEKSGTSQAIPITVVVAGQIITGEAVSESEYFSHDFTSPWKELFDAVISNPRSEHLNVPEDEFDLEKIPDELKQGFLFLRNAFYINGDKTIPSIGNEGIPIQVRLADIVAFNFGNMSFNQN